MFIYVTETVLISFPMQHFLFSIGYVLRPQMPYVCLLFERASKVSLPC